MKKRPTRHDCILFGNRSPSEQYRKIVYPFVQNCLHSLFCMILTTKRDFQRKLVVPRVRAAWRKIRRFITCFRCKGTDRNIRLIGSPPKERYLGRRCTRVEPRKMGFDQTSMLFNVKVKSVMKRTKANIDLVGNTSHLVVVSRVCLGQQLALLEAGYATVRILQQLPHIEPMGDERFFEDFAMTSTSGGGCRVRLSR